MQLRAHRLLVCLFHPVHSKISKSPSNNVKAIARNAVGGTTELRRERGRKS